MPSPSVNHVTVQYSAAATSGLHLRSKYSRLLMVALRIRLATLFFVELPESLVTGDNNRTNKYRKEYYIFDKPIPHQEEVDE